MEPVTQVAAAVTIASGCIATAIAVGGVTAKVILRLISHRELIATRLHDLYTHLHETHPQDDKEKNDNGPRSILKRIHKIVKHKAVTVEKMTKDHLRYFFKLIHPDSISKTLYDLSDLVNSYEDAFQESAVAQDHMGMHGAIAGAAIVASQVMDITNVFNECLGAIPSKYAYHVIETVFKQGHAPIEHSPLTMNKTLTAYVVFLGSLISFDRIASKYPDFCTLGETPDGGRRMFSLWMGSDDNDGVMRHTLKRLRDEIRNKLADEKYPSLGGKKKRETMEHESSSSSSHTEMEDSGDDDDLLNPPAAKRQRIEEVE